MRPHSFLFALSLAICFCAAMAPCRADNGWDRPVFQLVEENDSGFSDRHYTQGAYLKLLSADHTNHNWLTEHLPALGYEMARWKWGGEAGQQMYTPENIAAYQLQRDDRPYAGWSYGGLIYQPRGRTARDTPVMETFRVQAGVVGPDSQANDCQIGWHHLWGFQRPNGWHNQLANEIGLLLGYDRRWRYAVGANHSRWSVQLLPECGVTLGNVRTDFHAGSTVRAGYNIPNEFGLNDSARGVDFGIHAFLGVTGRAVLLDVFLDGNNFRQSHHVEKEPFVADLKIGGAITTHHLEIALMHTHRTPEFTAQSNADGFTSLTMTVKF